MGKLRSIFTPKPKQKQAMELTSLWYYVFVAVIIILALSLALLWPEQLSALWFEFWLLVLQFLRTPIHFQMWWFIPFVFFVAWLGWFTVPTIEILSTKERFLYRRTWIEGDLRYFRTVRGYLIALHKDAIVSRGLRWTIKVPVFKTAQGTLLVYQTKNLEVNTSLMWKRVAESLTEELKKYRAEKERKETIVTWEQYIEALKAKHGGEKE